MKLLEHYEESDSNGVRVQEVTSADAVEAVQRAFEDIVSAFVVLVVIDT